MEDIVLPEAPPGYAPYTDLPIHVRLRLVGLHPSTSRSESGTRCWRGILTLPSKDETLWPSIEQQVCFPETFVAKMAIAGIDPETLSRDPIYFTRGPYEEDRRGHRRYQYSLKQSAE